MYIHLGNPISLPDMPNHTPKMANYAHQKVRTCASQSANYIVVFLSSGLPSPSPGISFSVGLAAHAKVSTGCQDTKHLQRKTKQLTRSPSSHMVQNVVFIAMDI